MAWAGISKRKRRAAAEAGAIGEQQLEAEANGEPAVEADAAIGPGSSS